LLNKITKQTKHTGDSSRNLIVSKDTVSCAFSLFYCPAAVIKSQTIIRCCGIHLLKLNNLSPVTMRNIKPRR